MTHSVTIEVPEHIVLAEPLKRIVVKFADRAGQVAYVALEARFCLGALQQLAAAWTVDQRRDAYIKLYEQRKKCYELTFKNTPTTPTVAA